VSRRHHAQGLDRGVFDRRHAPPMSDFAAVRFGNPFMRFLCRALDVRF